MVHARSPHGHRSGLDLPLALVITMLVLLWIAGGASRAEVMAQVFVRAGAWIVLTAAILFGPRPAIRGARPVLVILAATALLPLVQLVPLPPGLWQALPGRSILAVPGETLSWRPLTMTPGATRNALASLVVPAAMLLLLMQVQRHRHPLLATMLLAMIAAAVLLGLLQFTGAGITNPLLNDTPGAVSSIFANRNHFALLVAVGCLVAPVWAFMDREALRWRGPLAAGLVLLFVLTILATGSRAGMLLGAVALGLALILVGKRLRRRISGGPRWLMPTLVIAAVLAIGGIAALSFAVDRADSIDRLIALETGEDMRSRARPTVLAMIGLYMPFGAGLGGFDPVFRISEPFGLLKPSYFNQAHNDFLGVALDAGLAGIALVAAALCWWLSASIRVWRAAADDAVLLARLGSGIILLVLAASVTDYPARTPTIMALLVIAAVWLAQGRRGTDRTALPD